MVTKTLRQRPVSEAPINWPDSVPKVLQRIYAARGVSDPTQIEHRLINLIPPKLLGGIEKAAVILADAIAEQKHITVAGDYDCDGATGTAVAVRGFRLLGATNVSFVIPNRFKHGYGLSPGLVDAMPEGTEVVVTVDSGTSSVEGVAHAKSLGRTVVITDHHLPGDFLPDADVIVNPNLKDEDFPSKMLAGVGVMFYVLLAIRAEQRHRGLYEGRGEPDLATLLDLVALGTVADLVPLDYNNRIIVEAGLRRIKQGKACPGVRELIAIANKDPAKLVAMDIGFTVAPRLNAAGRLENMTVGVEALITDDSVQAFELVGQLDRINKDRREIQATMIGEAEKIMTEEAQSDLVGVTVFDPSWHSGVVGLVASKLKESLHRPVFALAPAEEGSDELRGSGRSIDGFHLRDALAEIDAKHPGLLKKFGGHAMAAGLSLYKKDVEAFTAAFNEVAEAHLDEERLQAVIMTDGELTPEEISIATARLLRNHGPWGQKFPEPLFENTFYCVDWKVMGNKHLKLYLEDPRNGNMVDAVYFGAFEGVPPPVHARVAFELALNEWNGNESLQLMVKLMVAA